MLSPGMIVDLPAVLVAAADLPRTLSGVVTGGSASVDAYAMTSGRAWTLVAAVPVVLSIVVGTIALVRSSRSERRSRVRSGAIGAMAGGVVGAVIGVVVVAAAEGGPGTGYGIVGGYIAAAGGLLGAGLGALAFARSRRSVADR